MPRRSGLDRKTLISTIWIFVLLNMIYCDIIGMLVPGYLEFLDKMSKEFSPAILLGFSVLLEMAIAMILLSRVLPRRYNRLANFIVVPISIQLVIFDGSGFLKPYYAFFGSVEIIAMLYIAWLAWKWPKEELEH